MLVLAKFTVLPFTAVVNEALGVPLTVMVWVALLEPALLLAVSVTV